jgi:hypothetical protein
MDNVQRNKIIIETYVLTVIRQVYKKQLHNCYKIKLSVNAASLLYSVNFYGV